MNITAFLQYFIAQSVIDSKAIKAYFELTEPGISQTAVNWRIHSLIDKGIIKRTGHGKYKVGKGKQYIPVPDSNVKKLYRKLRHKFLHLHFCVWNTKQFNEFMMHQPGSFYTIIETEPESGEYVFHFLQRSHTEVFWNPTKSEIEKYVSVAKNAIVVINLVSEAPLQVIDALPTISIEKLLVDVFCNSDLFAAQQGMELETIFRTATEKYTVNYTKLNRYAARRNRKNEITEYLNYLTSNTYNNDR